MGKLQTQGIYFQLAQVPKNIVVIEGDSIPAAYLPIFTELNKTTYVYTGYNYAVGASSINYPNAGNEMTATTRIAACNAKRQTYVGDKNILCTFEMTNELLYNVASGGLTGDAAATAVYNAAVGYYGTMIGNGFICILNTCLPSTTAGNPTFATAVETARQNHSDFYDASTINGKLRNDFTIATNIANVYKSPLAKWVNCWLVDLGSNATYGLNMTQAADTNLYVDGTHPTASTALNITTTYYIPTLLLA